MSVTLLPTKKSQLLLNETTYHLVQRKIRPLCAQPILVFIKNLESMISWVQLNTPWTPND